MIYDGGKCGARARVRVGITAEVGARIEQRLGNSSG